MTYTVLWQPGAKASCFDACKHQTQKFAERRRIHGHDIAELTPTVMQVLVVDDTAW